MKLTAIILSAALGLSLVNAEDEIFRGGESPIDGKDSNRAKLAAARVKPDLERDLKAKGLEIGDPLFIRVFKESSELEVWLQPSKGEKFKKFRTYRIARFSGQLGPKEKRGDRQAPEGFYYVRRGAMNPHSRFHLSFDLGYPNAYDQAYGRTGDYLMVHGNRVSIGCFAMTDASIEQIWTLADASLKRGQPYFRVHCFPFRMTEERMARAKTSEWYDFWKNIREGYKAFEEDGLPPSAEVSGKRYTFKKAGS
ncbi:MAG: murein L,D-transpeptidase YafK [Verrucomicrobiales bacterium]|jgi:murein L,D-transpeptidase YafK